MSQLLRLWKVGYTSREDIEYGSMPYIVGMRRFFKALTHPQPRCACKRESSSIPKPCPCPTDYNKQSYSGEYGGADLGSVLCYCCSWCRSRPECESR